MDVKTFLSLIEIKGPVVYSFHKLIDNVVVYLYIGSTTDLRRRILEHHIIGNIFELRPDLVFEVVPYSTINLARESERVLINKHKPIYNSRGKGKRLDIEGFDFLIDEAEKHQSEEHLRTPWLNKE